MPKATDSTFANKAPGPKRLDTRFSLSFGRTATPRTNGEGAEIAKRTAELRTGEGRGWPEAVSYTHLTLPTKLEV